MTPVEMPKANENLTEATLEDWLVQEGEQVAKDQALCIIVTDKASFELPAPCAGVVRKCYGLSRSVLPVGYILCALGMPEEPLPEEFESRNTRTLAAHRGALLATAPGATDPNLLSGTTSVRATPAARRVAKELGVELAAVARALNLQGPVSEKDVRVYAENRRN